jgi:uncharacterized protein YecE (DUF72 family)
VVIRIGTSGWSYDHWHPELYPPGLPPRDRLARYAAAFPTAELNSSFYRWPRPAAFSSWRDRLPDGFRLSVKAPRGLTHARKLHAPEAWLYRIAAGWHELGDKRAVLLVQLPPSLPRDDARLEYFLGLVPGWMRVAVEFRHRSWHCEEIFTLLEAHRAAYCVMSGANLPCTLRPTTDFVYLRMHGPDHHHLYAGSYPQADLTWWADRIREWDLAGLDVFVYFNNDGNANAVRDARTLAALPVSALPARLAAPRWPESAPGRQVQRRPSSWPGSLTTPTGRIRQPYPSRCRRPAGVRPDTPAGATHLLARPTHDQPAQHDHGAMVARPDPLLPSRVRS